MYYSALRLGSVMLCVYVYPRQVTRGGDTKLTGS